MKEFKIQLRITEKMLSALQEACEQYGMSMSELLRQILMKFIMGDISLF